MVDEANIAKFSAAQQAKIRAEIKEWTSKGHSPCHLAIADDGSIYLDRDLIDSDSYKKASRGDFDK